MTLSPASGPVLVTGASGLVGSHLVERLHARGVPVRALVRSSSRTEFLDRLGIDRVVGDLTDPAACARAVEGVGVVFHAAAKVGDWATWAEFKRDCLEATAHLADAAIRAGVGRFLHISSTSAYGHPREGGPPVDERGPLGQHFWPIWDGYTWSKYEQERLLWDRVARDGLKLSVIRPSWIHGERDRTSTARMVQRLQAGQVRLIGPGDNPISAIYAGDVAQAAILAADDPNTIGEAYNITDQGPINQREYLSIWARAVGVPARFGHVDYHVTFAAALAFEAAGRLTRSRRPPLITRYASWLMGRNVSYSTAKAREKLGWRPLFSYEESIGHTVRWYLDGADPAARTLG